MNIFFVILILTCSCIMFVTSLYLFISANKIKIKKQKEKEDYKYELQNEVKLLLAKKEDILKQHLSEIEKLDAELKQTENRKRQEIQTHANNQKDIINQLIKNSYQQAEIEISNIQKEVEKSKKFAELEKQKIQKQINNLKETLNAGVAAKLREQEKKEKLNFYKLTIDERDLADIQKLESLKATLNKPVILSKLIWTQYFQKQVTELCDRILGKSTISGIYKITNLVTDQCYIGQSVNVSDRWKAHCKCGLGIQASATNSLYNSMQKHGIWNFTFELLQKCPKELLDEKQAFWINMYNSNIYGLNTTAGNRINKQKQNNTDR